MDNRISRIELDNLYKGEIKKQGKVAIDELVKRKRSTEKDPKREKTIFLCHAHQDKTIVEKVTLLFDKLDINIYVDWMDDSMPKVTNKNTAELIRAKIEHCNRFIFLASYYGLRSKWCDWELGIAYSIKAIDELAILPIESKSGRWEGSEYLQLYPTMIIGNEDLNSVDINQVVISKSIENTSVSLEKWLIP